MPNRKSISGLFASALIFCAAGVAQAQEPSWQVSKSSGEVWITAAGVQQVSLTTDTSLKPGDSVRTGRNGRVLLVRGEQRILVSPNTAIDIPSETKGDVATTLKQRAGTILLDVEKRNVKHFEVETPYLAALVKGTQFRVSVEKGSSRVEVLGGQVQVVDFKSGQNVLVLPGQVARSLATAAGGLQMSGRGRFNAIEQGTPRQSTVRAIAVPAGGLKAPAARAGQNARPDLRAGQTIRAGQETRGSQAASRAFASEAAPGGRRDAGITRNSGLRIGSMIGDVKLDYTKVTNGLARGASDAHPSSAMSGLGPEASLGMGGIARGNGGSGSTGGGTSGGGSSAGGTGGGGGGGGGSSSTGSSSLVGTTVGVLNGVVSGAGGTVGGLLGGLGIGKKK